MAGILIRDRRDDRLGRIGWSSLEGADWLSITETELLVSLFCTCMFRAALKAFGLSIYKDWIYKIPELVAYGMVSSRSIVPSYSYCDWRSARPLKVGLLQLIRGSLSSPFPYHPVDVMLL
jgi:hypothetical protein